METDHHHRDHDRSIISSQERKPTEPKIKTKKKEIIIRMISKWKRTRTVKKGSDQNLANRIVNNFIIIRDPSLFFLILDHQHCHFFTDQQINKQTI